MEELNENSKNEQETLEQKSGFDPKSVSWVGLAIFMLLMVYAYITIQHWAVFVGMGFGLVIFALLSQMGSGKLSWSRPRKNKQVEE